MDWAPDNPSLGNRGNEQAVNAYPAAQGYQPFPSLSVLSTALTARPRGGIEAFDKDNASHLYAGDATKLYEFDADNLTWTDVTNSGGNYTTASGENWAFARWKNKVLSVNWDDNPQQITMGGANFSDLSTAFKARNIAVIRDFVVVSNTYDSTDGNVPNRVRWSAQDDETDWTVSASTQADYRDLTTGGAIKKIVGGEVGIIVSERAVFRMDYVGTPVVFQIDEILSDIGAVSAGAVTDIGSDVYFISDQGFIELKGRGTEVNRIGAGRVDKFFQDDYDSDHPERIWSITDPTSNRVMWAYPGSGHSSGRPNKIIIYDRTFNKWSIVEEEVEMIIRTRGVDITLDELDGLGFDDLDTMTVSLDSNQFKALSTQLAAFDEDFKLGFFRGATKTATLETGETEFNPGYMTALNAFLPLVDLGTVTAKVGTRNRQSDAISWGSSLTQSSTGRYTARAKAKYHSFRFEITGDDWTDALGVQIPKENRPRAERRA